MPTGETLASLGLTVDLRAEPWRYPGPFLPFSCRQNGEHLTPFHGDFTGSHFVIAIGSNASPDVLRRKLAAHTNSVAQIVARLDGFAIGHSAHLSRAGYVPATPYPRAGASAPAVVAALTAEQVRCLDETEPNYDRVTVPGAAIHSAIPLPPAAPVYLYQSKWGVLADAAGEPVPFSTQEAVLARLAEWNVLPASITVAGGVPATVRALAGDAAARAWITARLGPHTARITAGGPG